MKSSLCPRLVRAAMSASFAAALALPVRAQTPATDQAASAAQPAASPQVKVDQSQLPRSTGAITSFAPVVDQVAPSVVTIFTTKTVKNAGNPMLRRFFGIPDDSGPENGEEGGESRGGKMMGLGSGVIVSADGLILTNNHVAEAGDEIMVRMGDHGHEYKAKKVGNDPGTDIALLKIDAKNLPVITFADSDKVKVGDIVLAVGSPFGLTGSVTMGIVSAIGRGGMGITDYENFIQTDASINPGNSGGALVDVQGRLIGLNTAIFSRSGGNQGIGFAVPSSQARSIMESLLKYGKVKRGYLGTLVQSLTPELADAFKVPADQQGALVSQVTPRGAAEEAGLKNGDVITSINGKAVNDPRDLRLSVAGMMPGTKVTVAYLREGAAKAVQVTLKTLPANGNKVASEDEENGSAQPSAGKSNALDGITVGELDDSARNAVKAPAELKGVLVTDVAQDSVGYEAGLRKGDIITEMNHKPLTSSDEAVDEGNKIEKNEKILLQVWSKGKTEYLILKPKE